MNSLLNADSIMENIKICKKCGIEKPVSEFFFATKNRLRAYCKPCDRARSREANIRNYDPKAERERYLRHKAKNPKRNTIGTIRSKQKFPEKYKARLELDNAMRRGDLIRGNCIKCGSEKTDGHHTDYTKPLDVMWLCRVHHAEQHRLMRVYTE